jgi:condensation domain-containing protein
MSPRRSTRATVVCHNSRDADAMNSFEPWSQQAAGDRVGAIPRQRGCGPFPLSFAQQRLWFLDQLQPNNPYYNIPRALRIHGPLNVAALKLSLQEIAERHETLRARIVPGVIPQLIIEDVRLSVPMVDLGGADESFSELFTAQLIEREAERPFNLCSAPLMRSTIVRFGLEDHLILLTMHHIASDGWSNGIFAEEISALYAAFSRKLPSPLPDLPIRYVDFAAWQHEYLQGAALDRHLNYWRTKLSGIVPLHLPTDKPRPAFQSFRGAEVSILMGKPLAAQLKQLSAQFNVSLFMVLLASFQILLSYYSGQEDIAVGSPIANRESIELQGLIGFFVNTLVLRTDLSGNPPFTEVIRRVREVTLEAYAHQALPFEKIVAELQPARDLGRNPFFQVMFTLQNNAMPPLQLRGLKVTTAATHSRTSKFDLSLDIFDLPGGLQASLEYNTDLFEESPRLMLDHYAALLEAIVEHPTKRIANLPPFNHRASSLEGLAHFYFDDGR